MKRAMTFLFWAHLLAIPCGVWTQEETEPLGTFLKELQNMLETITRAAPQVSACL